MGLIRFAFQTIMMLVIGALIVYLGLYIPYIVYHCGTMQFWQAVFTHNLKNTICLL
jgi:hypothetical protein